MDQTEELFKELTEAHGVSGHEEEVSRIMAKRLSAVAEISYDNLGSLIAEQKGTSAHPKVMLAGHMDEVGFMVKEITKGGFVRFLPLGGWWGHVILSQRVSIRTSQGGVVGVVGSKPPHELEAEEKKKVLPIKDMYIDVGASSDFDVKKRLGIRPGDPITPLSPFTVMNNKKAYMAKAWDNRIGCALVIQVLEKMTQIPHPNTIYGVGTVQEEVGLRGAITSSNQVSPDLAFALDVSLARDMPDFEDKPEKLGGGPSILVYDGSMIPNCRLRDLVVDTAEAHKIPYHFTSIEGGGTNGGRIHLNKFGVPTLTMGIPTRYIHGHVGILHRDDYENAVKLLVEVLRKLDEKEVQKIIQR